MPVRYQNSSLSLGRRDTPKSIDLNGAVPRNALPISPPETDRITPSLVTDSRPLHSHTSSLSYPDGLQVTPPTAMGEPPSRYRRSPSIPYMQSGLQSRTHLAPNRPARWLLVVVPPSSLNSEPALGHTLSTGPPGRFQSGILMPLFPTLYGQLAAISKEFNLPSTTGVCIYLHVSDRALNMAPRISDEAWQLLWGHYFIPDEGAPSYPSHQLPICGQIEFDVDIRKARWYESWVSGHAHHPSLEAGIPPAIAQSLSRWYADATKDRDEEPDVQDETTSVRGKHIPRPLALARREGSVRSVNKYKAINCFDGDAGSTVSRAVPRRLPPVVQANEPATAKEHDLNTLVRNWRATTPAVPALPREEGTAKDTLESPGFELDLDDFQWSISSAGPTWGPDNVESVYAYSVDLEARLEGSVALTPSVATSFGPEDVPTPAFSNVSRYPSPDLAARVRGSAPISPVTATSWGAPLSWPTTPASIERILSPDLATRMDFSRPETPMTATSWGAPEHWPASPFESFRPYTPDIGFREQHSRPVTPSTSTSWGAPEDWPPTPFERTRPHTPDCAERAHDEDYPVLFIHAKPWAHVWPFSEIRKEQQRALLESTNGSFRFVWPFMAMAKKPQHVQLESQHGCFQFVWPFIGKDLQPAVESTSSVSRNVGGSAMAMELEMAASLDRAKPWAHVWPFSEIRKEQQRALLESKKGSFRFVWPFLGKEQQSALLESKNGSFQFVWPFMDKGPQRALLESEHGTFQFVWPFMAKDPQPAMSRGSRIVGRSTMAMVTELETNNKSDSFAFVWPFFQTARFRPSPQSVVIPSTYPFLQIYRSVYPHIDEVYASKSVSQLEIPKCRSVRLHNARAYDYPRLVIYPSKDGEGDNEGHWRAKAIDVKVKLAYPDFDLYQAVYPFICPYPVPGELDNLKIKSVILGSEAPEYPVIDVYNTGVIIRPAPQSVRARAAYPAIVLYEDVYPSLTVYPPVVDTVTLKAQPVLLPTCVYNCSVTVEPKNVTWTGSYSRLNLYPAIYPHVEPYPPCDAVELKAKEVLLPSSEYHYPAIGIYGPASQMVAPEPCSVFLPSYYGHLNLYPACYPNLEVYPAADPVETKKQSVLLSSQECEYPDLLIYPGCKLVVSIRPQELPVMLRSSYGRLNLYPATYPPEPYPPADHVELKIQSVLKTNYEYPAIVIYPGCACAGPANIPVELPTRLPVVYPFFDLYPAVYPSVEPYPNAHVEKIIPTTPEFIYPNIVIYAPVQELIHPTYIDVKLPRTQGYPSFDLYEPGYPVICPYPAVCGPAKAMALEGPKLRSVKVTVDRRVAYPHLEPYTPLVPKPTPLSVRLSVVYPAFNLYPALDSIYPSIEPAAQCMKLSPLQHDGFVYPKIIIYQPPGHLQPRFSLALTPGSPITTKQYCIRSSSNHLPPLPRKTHAQLHNETFQGVPGDGPQHANPNSISILSRNPHPVKRRKTHQQLWQAVFPNGPKPDIPPALASPVSELPTFNQASRLGRSRSASIVRSQPTIGVSRTPSLRSIQSSSLIPAPAAPRPGRMRAMSRATVRPTVDAEPSTRTQEISLSFLSRSIGSIEEKPSDTENSPVRRIRPGSIVQRTADMLTHQDEKHGPEPTPTGARLSRTPSKLDRSKFPFA